MMDELSSGITPPRGNYRILVVDDEEDILRVVRYGLEASGFEVVPATSAAEALRIIESQGLPHLAVVDIMMPEMDGLELCREIHRFCDLPVILLTAVSEEETIVRSIQEVAEDYVTKPFRPNELAARVERVLRRVGDFSYALAPEVRIDDRLAINFARQQVEVDGSTLSLTRTESKILYILVRDAGRTVTNDFLLRRVWPLEEIFEDTLRVHLHRLRRKIEPVPSQPKYLLTHRGVGYSFVAPAA